MFEAAASEIAAACEAGRLPAGVALMRLVMAASAREQIDRVCAEAGDSSRLAALWRRHPDFWALAKALQSTVDHGAAGSTEAQAHAIAEAFDRAAELWPDAACALYALDDPVLLDAATSELVDYLADLGRLSPRARILDIGCGAGRLLVALAGRVALLRGLETSAIMAATARRRCAGLTNVAISHCPGGEPPVLVEAGFDLAIAADVFPYIVQCGGDLPARWFKAAADSLASGGALVIFNFSYTRAPDVDIKDAAELGRGCGLVPRQLGHAPFQHWDGVVFLFEKP